MAWEGIQHPITATSVKFTPGQRARYVPNHRSFGAFMRSEQMRDVTADVARGIANEATSDLPPPSDDSEVVTYTVKRESGVVRVAGNIRVKVEVEGQGPGAGRAEFGRRGKRRFRTLGRAGLKFGDLHHSERITKAR